MRSTLLILAATLLLFSCQKENNTDSDNISLEGAFIGTFYRTGMDTVSVTLSFDGQHFQGNSSRDKYPAICSGSYEVNTNSITFTDTCTWTADFDWSLILDNNYTFSRNDSVISFFRTNGATRDEYRLTRLVR